MLHQQALSGEMSVATSHMAAARTHRHSAGDMAGMESSVGYYSLGTMDTPSLKPALAPHQHHLQHHHQVLQHAQALPAAHPHAHSLFQLATAPSTISMGQQGSHLATGEGVPGSSMNPLLQMAYAASMITPPSHEDQREVSHSQSSHRGHQQKQADEEEAKPFYRGSAPSPQRSDSPIPEIVEPEMFAEAWKVVEAHVPLERVNLLYPKMAGVFRNVVKILLRELSNTGFNPKSVRELKSRQKRGSTMSLDGLLTEAGVSPKDMKEKFSSNPQEREDLEAYVLLTGVILVKNFRPDPWTEKYQTMAQFKQAYPELVEDSNDEQSLGSLLLFANVMSNVLRYVNGKGNQQRLLTLVACLSEGRSHSRYITGGAQSKRTSHRVLVYRRESNTAKISRPRRRTRNDSSDADESTTETKKKRRATPEPVDPPSNHSNFEDQEDSNMSTCTCNGVLPQSRDLNLINLPISSIPENLASSPQAIQVATMSMPTSISAGQQAVSSASMGSVCSSQVSNTTEPSLHTSVSAEAAFMQAVQNLTQNGLLQHPKTESGSMEQQPMQVVQQLQGTMPQTSTEYTLTCGTNIVPVVSTHSLLASVQQDQSRTLTQQEALHVHMQREAVQQMQQEVAQQIAQQEAVHAHMQQEAVHAHMQQEAVHAHMQQEAVHAHMQQEAVHAHMQQEAVHAHMQQEAVHAHMQQEAVHAHMQQQQQQPVNVSLGSLGMHDSSMLYVHTPMSLESDRVSHAHQLQFHSGQSPMEMQVPVHAVLCRRESREVLQQQDNSLSHNGEHQHHMQPVHLQSTEQHVLAHGTACTQYEQHVEHHHNHTHHTLPSHTHSGLPHPGSDVQLVTYATPMVVPQQAITQHAPPTLAQHQHVPNAAQHMHFQMQHVHHGEHPSVESASQPHVLSQALEATMMSTMAPPPAQHIHIHHHHTHIHADAPTAAQQQQLNMQVEHNVQHQQAHSMLSESHNHSAQDMHSQTPMAIHSTVSALLSLSSGQTMGTDAPSRYQ